MLEQLHRYMNKVVDNIIRAKPRRVIHIEPTREILGWNLIDFNERIYSYAMDYPCTLISELVRQKEKGRIEIITKKKLGHTSNQRHYPALIVWEVKESN